jgi:hypothetical protein
MIEFPHPTGEPEHEGGMIVFSHPTRFVPTLEGERSFRWGISPNLFL